MGSTTERRHGETLPVLVWLALMSWPAPPSVAAQPVERPLRLADAVSIALRSGSEARAAAAMSEAAGYGAREASSALYPVLSLETGVMRSSDPVAAFGTKLRQGRFGEADFALRALNDPDPVTDWTAGVRIEWAGLDPSVWAASSAAGFDADAARYAEIRTLDAVRFRTTVAYYDAVRADARLRAAEAAVRASEATRDRFRRRMEEGLLTQADLLRARAELAAAEAGRLTARQARDDARRVLGLALGWDADSLPVPTDSLVPPAGSSTPADLAAALHARADIRALEERTSAARARSRSASSTWFPRLEAFGGYTAHARDPFTSDGSEWTVGLGLRWDAFTGFRRPSAIGRARAEARALVVQLERTRRAAEVEARQAADGVESARLAHEASRLASGAAAAGRDLMRRRFEEGLVSAADLLAAEARATDLERAEIDALAGVHVALARFRFAIGDAGTDTNRPAAPGAGAGDSNGGEG